MATNEADGGNSELVEAASLALCEGLKDTATLARLVDDHGASESDARDALAAARARILRASVVDRDFELGMAYSRVSEVYARAMAADDPKTALAASKEMTRLLGLYPAAATAAKPAPEVDGRLETAVKGYLVPLGLASASAPLVEVVRLASVAIIQSRSGVA